MLRAGRLKIGARLLVVLTAFPLAGQTRGGPWELITFGDGGDGEAEMVAIDHGDPGGRWLESRVWLLDPNGRALTAGVTATIEDGSVTTLLRMEDVATRWSFELEQTFRGLTADGGAFRDATDLLGEYLLTRLEITVRTNGMVDEFTAPSRLLNDANELETGWLVSSLLGSPPVRQLSLSEAMRRSVSFLHDTACDEVPARLDVFCSEVVPALLRGRPRDESSGWSVTETASLAGDNPRVQRVLRSFPRRDRRTRYAVGGR